MILNAATSRAIFALDLDILSIGWVQCDLHAMFMVRTQLVLSPEINPEVRKSLVKLTAASIVGLYQVSRFPENRRQYPVPF